MLSVLFVLAAQATQYLILWPVTPREMISASILTTLGAIVALKVEQDARWGRQDLDAHHHTSLSRWLAMVGEVVAWTAMIFAPLYKVWVIP